MSPRGTLFDMEANEPKDPQYTHAGTSMGTENVMQCDGCGALLREGSIPLHNQWHARVR